MVRLLMLSHQTTGPGAFICNNKNLKQRKKIFTKESFLSGHMSSVLRYSRILLWPSCENLCPDYLNPSWDIVPFVRL